jgi:hypothetical protein
MADRKKKEAARRRAREARDRILRGERKEGEIPERFRRKRKKG